MIRLLAVACAVLLAGCGGDDAEGPSWNHDTGDAELGPAAWGEIDESFEACATGSAQSPVDVTGGVDIGFSPLEHVYPATPLVIENTGHVVEVAMPEGGAATLAIGDSVYRLVQYHFHAPSEHTFDGEQYDAEVHLVHQADDGELVVVGRVLDESERPSDLVDLVLESAPEEAGEEVELDEARSAIELIVPLDSESALSPSYVTYRGSLTTPGCTEGVRWILLPGALGISPDAKARLHELIADFPGYDGHENNNRPTQPLGDRVIERSGP